MIERLNRAGKIYLHPIGHAKKGERKNQSQCARLIDKQLETIIFVPCYLELQAFIFIVIPYQMFL